LRLVEKELKTNLGSGNFIFVGSMIDMWAAQVPTEWLVEVAMHLEKFPANTYLFQTKNPAGFKPIGIWPHDSIFAVTMETNRSTGDAVANAPPLKDRLAVFDLLKVPRKMVGIEPIMDFDPSFVEWIQAIRPEFVSIGADSKSHHLPEPPAGKVRELIQELEKFTKVIQKDNLRRLLTPRRYYPSQEKETIYPK
jgi:hypothetical protein